MKKKKKRKGKKLDRYKVTKLSGGKEQDMNVRILYI